MQKNQVLKSMWGSWYSKAHSFNLGKIHSPLRICLLHRGITGILNHFGLAGLEWKCLQCFLLL